MLRSCLAFFCVASLALLPACSDAAGTDDDGGTDGGAPDANPPTGAWEYMEGASISDSCMIPGYEVDASTEFGLTNNGDGSFTVLREGQNIECDISGSSFSCAPVALDPATVDGVDATINFSVTYVGTFDSDTMITGERTIDTSCSGAACAQVESLYMMSFPCALVDAFTASFG
jgi:hypothetical protein